MTQQDLLIHIKDALQRDEDLIPEMKLEELEEWDSLAIVSLINLYDSYFSLGVTGNQLRNCQNVADLICIVKDKLEK